MHGFCSGSSLLVNAEADSMGGIFGIGVGISTESSPRQVAIEKVQAELRVEHDVREERRKELEYLEKGGNPLDFKFLVVAPVSVQSSSLADQRHGQFRTCEAKGSSALAASPHGDSIGSSGRQGATLACEPNSADNFDGENELIGSQGKPTYASRSNIIPSEHSSQLDGSQNVRESEDSPIFHPKKAYRRRNRSKTNRDSARSSSTAIGFCGGINSSLSDRHGVVSKVLHDSTSNNEVDGSTVLADPTNGVSSEDKLDLSSSKHMHDDLDRQNVKDVVASNSAVPVEPDPFIGSEYTTSAVSAFPTCFGPEKSQNVGVPKQPREPDHLKDGEKCSQTKGVVSSIALTLKGLDSESSCTQASIGVDRNGNIDVGLCSSLKYKNSIDERVKEKLPLDPAGNINHEVLVDTEVADVAQNRSCINDDHVSQNYEGSNFPEEDEGGTTKNQLLAQDEAQCKLPAQKIQSNQHTNVILVAKQCSLDDTIDISEGSEKPQHPNNPSVNELTKTSISCSASLPELQLCDQNQPKVVDKEHKERILEEARNIMAKHKIREELFLGSMPKESRQKTHWDFVLEEMVWMANDFAQERVWKRTAATQLCYRAAFASHLRLAEQSKYGSDKIVAQTLARAVADFWHSAALLVGENSNVSGIERTATSEKTYYNWNGNGSHDEEYLRKNIKLAVQGYAVRFLQHNRSILSVVKDASSETPETVSTIGVPEPTYQNQRAEENLFYVVPHRAMEAYRKSIERYLVQCERASKYMQEVHTSTYEAAAEFDSQENGYEEDEGENLYYLPGCFESSNISKFSQKKGSNPNLYSRRLYDMGGDFSYGPCMENRTNSPESSVKRPANGLNVCPIPTKRVRTASRQRVVGPFRSGAAGFMSVPSRTEASSGDTNSFQDDQSTQGGGSLIPKGLEVESGMNYDKQAAFDSTEFTPRPKKKKKTKHQGTAYEPRWQADYSMQNEQRNHFKKRSQSHQFDSYGNSGPFGHHAKKPKTAKQSLDNSFENTTLMSGSVASPVGSQMSNMSNTNKLIKLIGGRDRGRKTKSLKVASGQIGSGSPWSLFEDQALVVLVHDMGPNWELVSDAINCTLHFKCIFRKPKECKDRHRILLEKNGGDGADTEDSGSSQPYPSTLPGIPKGGARQLFQQLRGPVEEDTIKCHFKKIILIGQQLHGRKKEPKQLVSAHSSHFAALSQVVPKNLNGGVLTPLDLCDMAMSSPDVFSLGHQGPYTGGLPLPNQGAVQSMHPSSSSSPPAQLNGTVRDGRYGIPRTNLPIGEQQRIQQYNHMLSGRTIQQPNMSVPDRSGHMLPSGNGTVISGMNRSMSMPKPGVQGVSSSSIQSSGSMAASKTVGMTSSMNMHSGVTPGQGSSLLRPRDGLHIARNTEHSRKMMSSEMRIQGSHTNNQGVPAFGGLTSTFPSQSASPPGTTYPVHNQQHHQMPRQNSNVLNNSHHRHVQGSAHLGSTEQQAFAMRLARDRQLQQRMFPRQPPPPQQQNHQFPASSALMSHVPSQSQLPISAALPKNSHIQSQAASQPVTLPPLLTPSSLVTPVVPQQQQKHQIPHHGLVPTAQQVQSSRHHPVQHQPSQSQQAKFLKGMGRGNIAVNQKHPVDSSDINGLSGSPGTQLEKGEKVMHPTQEQVYPIQSSNASKPVVPPTTTQSHPQQKLYSNTSPASSKKVRQVISHPDSSNSNQTIRSPTIPSHSHQQLKVHQQLPSNLINDTKPAIQKVVAQNRVANSDQLAQLHNEQQLANNSSISTSSGIPPACVNSAHAVPVATSDGSLQWKTSESPSDSIIPTNPQLGSIDSPVSNSSTNEPIGPGG